VRVYLQPSGKNQDQFLTEYSFYMATNSSNQEEGSANQDNQRQIRIPIGVNAELKFSSASKPESVQYNVTEVVPDKYIIEDQLGQEVFHVYDIKNRGPSTIQEAEVIIMWPSFDENGDHLLYLLGVEYDRNIARCETIDNINPLYVKVISY